MARLGKGKERGKAGGRAAASGVGGAASRGPLRFFARHKQVIGRVALILLVLLLTLVPVLFVNNVIGYLPILAFVLVVALSFVYLRLLSRALEYSEDSLASSCERGMSIDFVVTFKNKGVLPFLRLDADFYIGDLFGNVDVSMSASMPLMPREQRDFSFSAQFDHLGTYSAGVKSIVVSDLLGLFSHTIHNDNVHEVEVLPRIFDVTRVDLSNVSVQESTRSFQPIVTDDMDYAGVREYRWGDPIKTIHWKLSARTADGEYFTRLFEVYGNPGLGIVIDSTSPPYDSESLMYVFDGIIESAMSVNEYARDQGIDSDIVYNDVHGQRCMKRVLGAKDSRSLVSTVPRISVKDNRDAIDLFTKEVNSVHGHGNVALCTAHVSEEVVSALLEAKMRKRNPLLFLVLPRILDDEERNEFLRPLRRLDMAGVMYYIVSSAGDLGAGEGA